ncbi:hypothetical protein [Aliiglaciecola sp. M165]|uniref:hypothetical protein n=1 Tax=Aliiglaciecola sp. M165 TaxID=2593649 RepID=UPI0011812B31|nr:hypothetical protein [Aliiglaciecola sp. M165]TRY32047.1 hypothetical protein FM019_09495 [Aliiglaciecola sp. M165]
MQKILTIKNKLLSVRGEMLFLNEADREIYSAKGEFSFINPTWTLLKGQHEIARIKRKLWSWSSKYMLETKQTSFELKRKSWSWTRKYLVLGGYFNGAVITGGFWDTSFEIVHRGKIIVKGDNELLSLRDTCHVTFYDDNQLDDLAAILVAMRLDKKSDDSGGAAGGGD